MRAVLFFFIVFINSLCAEEPEFVRLKEEGTSAKLQTTISQYEKAGVSVSLIGAIHIADKSYYQALNAEFEKYDVVLFELIGGESYGKGRGLPKNRGAAKGRNDEDPSLKFIRQSFHGLSQQMNFAMQVDVIDYGKKNFLHADFTRKEFLDLQEDRGENLMTFALAESAALEASGNTGKITNLLGALLSNNPEYLKLQYARLLASSTTGSHGLTGASVIIDERNEAAIKVLKKQLKKGVKKIGIFYGAAHFHGMHKSLERDGFVLQKHDWLTAWDIKKKAKE